MKKDIKWLKKELKKCLAISLKYDNHYSYGNSDAYNIALSYVDELEKPVIPKFVADWIEEFSLQGSNPLKVYEELSKDFSEGWTTDEDARVYHWINKNPYEFIDALRYGYEVEEEKKYRA